MNVGARKGAVSRSGAVVAFLLIVAAVLILHFDRRSGRPGPVGQTVARGVAPLHGVVTAGGEQVRDLWKGYVALTRVRVQNAELRAELNKLRAQAVEAANLAAENERLRTLLDLGDRRKDLRLRAARVVARGTSEYFRVLRITIDVGEEGKVAAGMPVIAPGGVVGQLRSVSGRRAEVLLVTDPRSAIDVVLEQSRARGVAVGTGEDDRYAAKLEYVQRSVKPVIGERVITTGDDARYPRGLVVGEVIETADDRSGPFQTAKLQPVVEIGALDEVFVVLGPSGLSADGRDLERPK